MKGLPNLIRLHKWKLDEQQRKLAELEALKRGFAGRIQALDAEMAAEGHATVDFPEAAHMLGSYVQTALQRRRHLQESVGRVLAQIEDVREQVADAFQELKRFELARDQQLRRKQKEVRRRERMREDEIGINMFRRRQNTVGD